MPETRNKTILATAINFDRKVGIGLLVFVWFFPTVAQKGVFLKHTQ
jgi:hypothetical protein